MWEAFEDDIKLNEDGFKNREEYKDWVRAWVEDSIYELGRIERYYLSVDDPTKELGIKIGEDNG